MWAAENEQIQPAPSRPLRAHASKCAVTPLYLKTIIPLPRFQWFATQYKRVDCYISALHFVFPFRPCWQDLQVQMTGSPGRSTVFVAAQIVPSRSCARPQTPAAGTPSAAVLFLTLPFRRTLMTPDRKPIHRSPFGSANRRHPKGWKRRP